MTRTVLRSGAAAFAVGIIGAGLVTTGASAESDELAYQCSADGDDGQYQVWFAFETDAPQSADENEKFRIDPVSADVRMAPETWGTFLDNLYLGDFTFTINVLPAGTSPGDDGTSDEDVAMPPPSQGQLPESGDYTFTVETPEGTELPSHGFGTNELQYTAGDVTIELVNDGQTTVDTLTCELVGDQDPVIDTVTLNSTDGDSDKGNDDQGNQNDETEDPNADVPTAVNGGL